MGKFKVRGEAGREVAYDAMELVIRFQTRGQDTKKAIDHNMEQLESFLEKLQSMGINFTNIYLGNDQVSQMYNDKQEMTVMAIREIKVKTNYDVVFANKILELVADGYQAEVSTNALLSNTKKIHEELMREALLDSKKKAEEIAKTLNMKVVGIDSAGRDLYGMDGTEGAVPLRAMAKNSRYQLSDQIQAPRTMESESFEVIWIIE